MQALQGSMAVEEIRGRNGVFCVGTLRTSIGDFKVKDAALDQFKPGSYYGTFLVERIYTKGVPWRGGFFTELIAKIAANGFLIDDEKASPVSQEVSHQAEPDPMDDSSNSRVSSAAAASAVSELAVSALFNGLLAVSTTPLQEDVAMARPVEEEGDAALFGVELFALFANRVPSIALDPSVDRELLRKQRDRLKVAGYRFEVKSQRWTLAR